MGNSIKDNDLEFLYHCNNEELKLLCDCICLDENLSPRLTESLTGKDEYKKYYPNNMFVLVPEIIGELQTFGGNTIANLFRGHGVLYREILCDVCDKMNVKYDKNQLVSVIEFRLMQAVMTKASKELKDSDLKELNMSRGQIEGMVTSMVLGSAMYGAATELILSQIAAKYGVALAGGFAARFIGARGIAALAGPIGIAFATLWSIFDIASPAYRVTIKAALVIAALRDRQSRTNVYWDINS